MKLYYSPLSDYMRRWIFRTRWFTIRVHQIRKSDEGRDFHDHPWNFTSFILWGGYIEHVPGCRCFGLPDNVRILFATSPLDPCKTFTAPATVRHRAEDLHRLELIDGKSAWTFVLTGAYRRLWGFLTSRGWIPFDKYERSYYR